jgi:PilZ domain-containing protein
MRGDRRYDRIKTDQAAVISFNGGKDQIACVIRDISDGGVGLSVARTVDIPDQFILTIEDEDEGRACTVRWRAADALGVSFDVAPVHWMTAAGALLIFLSSMICIMMFVLPAFVHQRTAIFWFVATPIAVLGAFMVLYRLHRDRQG